MVKNGGNYFNLILFVQPLQSNPFLTPCQLSYLFCTPSTYSNVHGKCSIFFQQSILIESPPPPPPPSNFIGPLGTLNFHLPLVVAKPNGGLKFFTLSWKEQQERAESLPYWPKIYSSFPYQEVPPTKLPVPNLDKKCVWLSDSAHFHETLSKVNFVIKSRKNVWT